MLLLMMDIKNRTEQTSVIVKIRFGCKGQTVYQNDFLSLNSSVKWCLIKFFIKHCKIKL